MTRFFLLISRCSSVTQIPFAVVCHYYGSVSGWICNFTPHTTSASRRW